jgi:hypothetical protein
VITADAIGLAAAVPNRGRTTAYQVTLIVNREMKPANAALIVPWPRIRTKHIVIEATSPIPKMPVSQRCQRVSSARSHWTQSSALVNPLLSALSGLAPPVGATRVRRVRWRPVQASFVPWKRIAHHFAQHRITFPARILSVNSYLPCSARPRAEVGSCRYRL